MNLFPIFILAAGGIILTIGDLVMKKWVTTPNHWFYVAGLFVWFIGLNFLAYSFKFKNIAVASTIFVLFNVITLAVFSWFVFNEKLTLPEVIGIFLGITSIVILELK